MIKHPLASRCPHCGSQSVEFLGERRPGPAKIEQHRWRCMSSRCGRSFKSPEAPRRVSVTKADEAA